MSRFQWNKADDLVLFALACVFITGLAIIKPPAEVYALSGTVVGLAYNKYYNGKNGSGK